MPWKERYTISDEKSIGDSEIRWPGGKRCCFLAVVDLRHQPELELIAVALVAGEVIQNPPARGHRAVLASRVRQFQFVDCTVRGERRMDGSLRRRVRVR